MTIFYFFLDSVYENWCTFKVFKKIKINRIKVLDCQLSLLCPPIHEEQFFKRGRAEIGNEEKVYFSEQCYNDIDCMIWKRLRDKQSISCRKNKQVPLRLDISMKCSKFSSPGYVHNRPTACSETSFWQTHWTMIELMTEKLSPRTVMSRKWFEFVCTVAAIDSRYVDYVTCRSDKSPLACTGL